jgi:5-methylcytosine-specific restriction endonuclease McrA
MNHSDMTVFNAASKIIGGAFSPDEIMMCVAAAYKSGIDISKRPKNFINRSGTTYGRLELYAPHPSSAKQWISKCSCGTWTAPHSVNVLKGRTVSCGCRMKEAQEEHRAEQRKAALAVPADVRLAKRRVVVNGYARSNRGKEMSKAWRDKNREKVNELAKIQRQKHAERYRAHTRNRRAKIKNIEGTHSAIDIIAIGDAQGWQCNACQCDLKISGHHVDHIVPIAKGGTNWPANLQLLCRSCNVRKHSKDYDVFLAELRKPVDS